MQLIKVGLCAFGMSGKVFHAPFLKEHPGFSLAAIVERNKEESKTKYPQSKIYTSVEEMLEDADVQIVVVNTPVQTHFEYAKKALEAGKNVIVEKPFTVNSSEAEELVQLAESKNLFLSVYQNRRFDRDYLQVQKVLEDGKLGKINEVEIRFDRYRTEASGKKTQRRSQKTRFWRTSRLGSTPHRSGNSTFWLSRKTFCRCFFYERKTIR